MVPYGASEEQEACHVVRRIGHSSKAFIDLRNLTDTTPELHSTHLLRPCYTPQRRIDPMAKSTIVEPGLTPLPRFVGLL